MDDKFIEKIEEQIEKNNALISEAKRTIDEMQAFFRSLGADLNSGHNIFLESKDLTKEGRRQAADIIAKFEREYEERYQQYRDSSMNLPGDSRPDSLKKSIEEDQRHYRETIRRQSPGKKVKKMRL
ncbi:MAG: hypothetical protein LBS68_00620 [Puniceicoccales bacterium]|jgi:hypothetical protein|nr:hypothetical protein [Puniceicoccales bacterium]